MEVFYGLLISFIEIVLSAFSEINIFLVKSENNLK